MTKIEEIPIMQISEKIIESASQAVAEYSIGFVRVVRSEKGEDAILVGSGTLISVGSTRAILTANHVLKALPTEGRLGLILSPSVQQQTVDVQGLLYIKIDQGTIESEGPDLGAVILGPSIAGTIAAKKTFFNLDLRRKKLLEQPLHLRDGFWIANGFIDEKTVEEPGRDGYRMVKGFYNYSGAGGPDQQLMKGKYDYFDFPVSFGARPLAPQSFEGMSGGGLWQVPLSKNDQGELIHKSPLLSGVVFYQMPTTDTECGVKCHGRLSVYNVVYEAIKPA